MATTVRIIFTARMGTSVGWPKHPGGGQFAAATAELYQVPERVPEAALQRTAAANARAAFAHIPIATVDHLGIVDAIIIGTPTRFGNLCV